MRDVFHHELDQLAKGLIDMTGLVGTAIGDATRALLEADLARAEQVIAADAHVDRVQNDLDERAIDLLARQQPVATDLRVVVASLRMSSSIERMGDLARHVAQLTRLRYPHAAVPADVAPVFERMGELAQRMAVQAGRLIETRDLEAAAQLDSDDDLLDHLHRQVFAQLLSPEWTHAPQCTVDVTLLSRFYERFGDHGVSVARRVMFLVTGDAGRAAAARER